MSATKRSPVVFLLVFVVFAVAVVLALRSPEEALPLGPPCDVTVDGLTVELEFEQAQNAATIAAVAKRMGMPNRAVTVALATAWQESKIYNLDYGDLDSLGIFQQRPSQDWGTEAQVMDPVYAATQFYVHLARIDGWASMTVNDAAQAVQRSAYPELYGQWEDRARLMARAFSGEEADAFTCRVDVAETTTLASSTADELRYAAGEPGVNDAVERQRGWMLAYWLVAHAETNGVRNVTFNGSEWQASTDAWAPSGGGTPAELVVRVNTTASAPS